ncbi:hypothetical protein ACROYT_G007362 [Oculina patagonica]
MAQSNPPLDSQYTKGRFANKVSIITGGSSGIGRATVKRFVNDGAAVAVFDINEPDGKKLQDELTASGYHVKFYKVDVADKEQCVQGVKKVAEDHEGKIHFLVNNAAISAPCKGLDSSKKDWDRLLGINLIGYSNMVQACYPFMTKERVLGESRKSYEPNVAKRQMIGRFCEPEEVAAAITFLCSKDASAITGTDLAVDGGYLALGPEGVGK